MGQKGGSEKEYDRSGKLHYQKHQEQVDKVFGFVETLVLDAPDESVELPADQPSEPTGPSEQ